MEKTIFIINSQSREARLCGMIAKAIFNVNVLNVDGGTEGLIQYSNNSIFDSGRFERVYMIDILPTASWVEDNLNNYPNLEILLLSRFVDENTYFNLANVIKLIPRFEYKTLPLSLFNYMKLNEEMPAGHESDNLIFRIQSLMFGFEKYAMQFDSMIETHDLYNIYTIYVLLTEEYYKLNLSAEELKVLFLGLNTARNNNMLISLKFYNGKMMDYYSKFIEEFFTINSADADVDIMIMKFNLDSPSYQLIDMPLTLFYNASDNNPIDSSLEENIYKMYFDVRSADEVVCHLLPLNKLLSPVPLTGQDTIDYITINHIAKMNLFLSQRYNITDGVLQTDGSMKFTLTTQQVFQV